jgi:formylglycine-generating enzyme required for sulfatase activity
MTERHELLKQIRKALVSLYADWRSAKRVADDAGIDSSMIARSDRPVDFWHDIVGEAEREGKLDALLAGVIEEYPARTDLVGLRDEYLALRRAEQEKPVIRQPPPDLPQRAPRSRWLWFAMGLLAVAVVVVLVSRRISIGTATPTPTETLQVGAMVTRTSLPQTATPTNELPTTVAPTPAETITSSPSDTLSPTRTATPSPTRTKDPSPSPTSTPNGIMLVYVPAGAFKMGSDASDPQAFDNEKPQHEVYLDGYRISRTEVTNAQYARCVEANACPAPDSEDYKRPELANRPVTDVSWSDANAYAQWVGGRLPTEAEWQKACRGADGRIYPWGNDAPTDKLLNYNDSIGRTTDVGSYPQGASPYGALDMAGNVWEWTSSVYKAYPYDALDGREDMNAGGERVLRGGAFLNDAGIVSCAFRYRYYPYNRYWSIGFRVVVSPSHS